MNKDKAPIHGDGGVRGGGGDGNGLPPQPSRYAAFGTSPSLSPSPSSTPPPEYDISGMPEFPPRNPCHRRAHSHFELISLPDDLDLGFPGAGDWPSLSDENDEELLSTFLDVDKLNSSCGASVAESSSAAALALGRDPGPRLRHHHSQSMDMSSSVNAEQLLGLRVTEGMSPAEAKKAMSAAKLAELALVDPKRAKRVWANRQSATRSKERKMRYIAELEWKVQTMRTQTATLSAQLTLLHRDTSGLTAENSELKLRLQNMEQQVHLQDALNDTLKTEVQRLKVATMDNGAVMMNFGGAPHPFGGNQQMFHHNQPIQSMLSAHHLQQLQIHPQHQQPLHPHQPLHPLQAQQLQQAAQDLKMKGPMAAQSQQVDGKSESRGG